MKFSKIIFLSVLFFVYILGMVLYCSGKMGVLNPEVRPLMATMENMEGTKGLSEAQETFRSCPNLLIKRGNMYLLYNTGQEFTEGVNPLIFQSLNDYTQYFQKQKQSGGSCPQLYVQEEYDAQGNQVMRIRPGPFDVGGGLSNYAANKASPIPVVGSEADMVRVESGFL